MNRDQANEILGYVAEYIISPLAFDSRPAEEVWKELTGDPFNKLVDLVNAATCKSCIKDKLKVIGFQTVCSSSSGEAIPGTEQDHNLMYNVDTLSSEQAQLLIKSQAYDCDDRVVCLSNKQLANLRGTSDEQPEAQLA